MHRINQLSCLVVAFSALSTGCADEAVPPPFDDVDVVGRDTNPDGVAYPSGDTGAEPRAGETPGDRIPNFSFQGYPESKRDQGLQVVSLADYYDPERKRHKLMLLMAVVGWCPHCQAETRATVAGGSELRESGVEVVQVMMQGPDRGRPLSLADVDQWVAQMGTTFTVVIDVDARRLSTVADIVGVPWNALIDTRSMEVLDVTVGEVTDVPAYVQGGVDWVDGHEPRP